MTASKFVKFVALGASILLSLSVAQPASAKAWTPTSGSTLTGNQFMANTAENSATNVTYSLLNNESRNEALCLEIGGPGCNSTDRLNGTFVMPVCTDAADTLCISNVAIFREGSAATPATWVRQIKAPVVNVAAASAATIPNGGATQIYSSTVPNAAGNTGYAVTAAISVAFAGGKLTADDYSVAVVPFNEKRGGFVGPYISSGQINDYTQPECAFLEDNICGEVEDFSAGTRVSVTVRVPAVANTFLGGRMTKVDLASTRTARGVNLTVTGNPVAVQQLELAVDAANPPAGLEIRRAYAKQTKRFSSLKAINTARGLLANKASGSRTFWQFNNWDGDLVANSLASKCASTAGIKGMFATDAITTDGFVPARDAGAFRVSVNGVLNNPDGKQDAGSVDVVLDSRFARCALGKTSIVAAAPTSARGPGYKATSSRQGTWIKASLNNLRYSGIALITVR
jgi:hypothetical protein